MIALLLLALPAKAAVTDVEFCVKFNANFEDAGADYWTQPNRSKNGRGVRLTILEYPALTEVYDGYTSDGDTDPGCATVPLDTNAVYAVYTQSEAYVNGVYIWAFPDSSLTDTMLYIHDPAFQPGQAAQPVLLKHPADELNAQLAVATWIFHNTDAGLGPLDSYMLIADDACCQAGDLIQAHHFSQTLIAHEIGHSIGYRRDAQSPPIFDYTANEDNCDPDGVSKSSHGFATKEHTSAAAVEGWAYFVSAWAWNDASQSDCTYDRHYDLDFDLDGVDDTNQGIIRCEGAPTAGLDPAITARDYLQDMTDAGYCTGSLSHRGTPYDWLRFFWDMYTDEAVPFVSLVDIYDEMNPRTFDKNASTVDPSDDPEMRLLNACSAKGYAAGYLNHVDNGVFH